MGDLKDEILEIFLSVREDRNAPYDENNFIQFLIKPKGRRVQDSWKGSRHFARFVERVELQYGVTFPNGFFDKKWSLAKFATYVDDRRRKPDVNRRYILKTQQELKHYPYLWFIALNAIVFWLSGFLVLLPYGVVLYLTVPILANVWLWRCIVAQRSYDKRLLECIEAQRVSLKAADTSARAPDAGV